MGWEWAKGAALAPWVSPHHIVTGIVSRHVLSPGVTCALHLTTSSVLLLVSAWFGVDCCKSCINKLLLYFRLKQQNSGNQRTCFPEEEAENGLGFEACHWHLGPLALGLRFGES